MRNLKDYLHNTSISFNISSIICFVLPYKFVVSLPSHSSLRSNTLGFPQTVALLEKTILLTLYLSINYSKSIIVFKLLLLTSVENFFFNLQKYAIYIKNVKILSLEII